jgi:DNA-binding transcriptional LysR family regulator
MKLSFTIESPATLRAVEPAHLPAVAAFAQVAHYASFSKAAAKLGVSPSALSQAVRGLEARIGVRLLDRTTRRVGLTEAGAQFLGRVSPALEQLATAFGELDEMRGAPTGTLRISLPRMAMRILIEPLLHDFCAAYPQIRLELIADDRFVDLIAEGYDAGIRLGERLAQDMIAVRATPELRSAVVGSPGYFRGRPKPVVPADLHRHDCLRFRFGSGLIYRWEFGRDGQDVDIDVAGPLVCNDNALMVQAAANGVGLAYVVEDLVRAELADGRLIRVLEDWCPPFPGLYLYYPNRAQLPLKLRALIDIIQRRSNT